MEVFGDEDDRHIWCILKCMHDQLKHKNKSSVTFSPFKRQGLFTHPYMRYSWEPIQFQISIRKTLYDR